MSTLSLARLLFAITAGTHFLFVSLTLGLATLVAITQTRAVVGGNPVHLRMTRYWGQLYVINYAIGIVAGLLMEFQFGLDWPGLTDHAGDVFGAPLALETIVAFFLEATFLGLWIFGWDRLNRWAHLALIWIVTLTAYASAYFIMVANGFLRHPVGFVRVGDELRIDDATQLFTNSATLWSVGHIVGGSFLVAGFFMAGVSAWHLRRSGDRDFYRSSMRTALYTIVISIVPMLSAGLFQFNYLKSLNNGSPVAGSNELLTVMMLSWGWMFIIALVSIGKLISSRWLTHGRMYYRVLMMTLPVPYVAMLAGWLYREGGRQPWLIQGVLRTKDAVRPMSQAVMLSTTIGITVLFAVLAVVNIVLLRKYARRGPDGATLGGATTTEALEPVPSF